MYRSQRTVARPIILILILATLLLVSCGTELASQNWPGMTTDGNEVYVAYGLGVAAVDIEARQLHWTFPDELSQSLLFFASPFVSNSNIILGDYGAPGGMFSPSATVTIYSLTAPDGNAPPQIGWSREDIATDRIIAPALRANGTVFIGTADNHLYALDADSGELKWEFPTGHSIWAQPVYTEGFLYVASLDNSLYALDPESGDLKWQATLGGSIASHPVLDEELELIYVPSFDRQLHALNSQTGEEVWQADAEDWVWGSPALGNDAVYFGDIEGNIYAVDAASGEQLWASTATGAIQSALLYDDGTLFITSGQTTGNESDRRGEIMALDAASGNMMWKQEIRVPVFSAPVLAGDAVVIVFQEGQSSTLNVFNKESGALNWEFELPAE